MKKIVSIIATIAMVMSIFTGTALAGNGNGNGNGKGNEQGNFKEFKDMKNHWGNESVEKMQSLGILEGYADGTFQPDKVLTQGELAVILERILDITGKSGEMEDEDVDDNKDLSDDEELSDVADWAKDAVAKGFQKKYLNQKRFNSKVQCDRLTACVAIAKALGLEPVTDFTDNPFKDKGLISEEDFGYLLALYKAGYINGYPDGNFNPNKMLSRAQIATIIAKLMTDGEVVSDDKTAPTWSSSSAITSSAIKSNSVDLKWSGATDDTGVVAYEISYDLNGTAKTKIVTSTTVEIGDLRADKEYTFTVEAKDAAGNWSKGGPSVTVTTLKEAVVDISAPTWASGSALTVSASTSGAVTLVWPDAEDNVGVDAYWIFKDGQQIETLDGNANNFNVTGLAADTKYVFKVRAVDAAGNISSSLSNEYLTN